VVTFSIYNIFTKVETENQNYLEIIDQACSFTHMQFVYKWTCKRCNQVAYFKGGKLYCYRCDSFIPFKKASRKPKPNPVPLKYFKNKRFPTGFLKRVVKSLSLRNIKYRWIDKRAKPVGEPISNILPKVRYYQAEARDIALNKTRGIIHIPTRGGKTYVAMDITFRLGLQTLVIVPDLYLLHQTYKTFKECLPDDSKVLVGLIGDSEWNPSMINIATIQTINSRFGNKTTMELLHDTKVLIVDEAHHINFSYVKGKISEYNTWMNVCLNTPAYYRIGLTVTPGKENSVERALLESVTGSIIYEIPLPKLIEEGYIAQPRVEIYFFEHKNPFIEDWRKAENEGVIDNLDRNKLIKRISENLSNDGENVLIVCDKIKHAKNIHEILPDASYLDGKSSSNERKKVVNKFESLESPILITTLFKEGVDLNFKNIIIGSSSKKERTVIQKSARVLTGGKSFVRIIDIYDKNGGILEKHSKSRLNVYKKLEFPITFKEGE